MGMSIFKKIGIALGKQIESPPTQSVRAKPSKARPPYPPEKPGERPKVKAPTEKSKAVPDINAKAAKPKPATKTTLTAQVLEKASAPDVATRLSAKDKDKLKDSVKTTTAKASKPEAVAAKPKVARTVAPGTIAKAALPAKAAPAPAPEPAPVASPSTPARAGRPSSRLAQLTVPSMAQSVASTAAKASFMKTTESPLIVPPLASAVKKDPKLVNNWKLKPVSQLTDADLIAMPDDEYMNDTQMAYFRLKLTKIKQDILSNAGETTEHLREDTVVVPDPADRATIEEEHALELRTRDRERKLLKKIEQSIQRIDAGDYGYCDETGESIGVGRLLARPTANLCLEAQQRRELKQKMFGD